MTDQEYTEIFKKHYPSVCYICENILGDKQDGEDVAVEVFLKLWEIRDRKHENIKAFLIVSGANTCKNILKAEKNTRRKSIKYFKEINFEEDGFFAAEIRDTIIMSEIYNDIEKLPSQCKEIFKMAYLHDMTNPEIAQYLHLSYNTIRQQKQIGLQKMKKMIGKKLSQYDIQITSLGSKSV